MDRRDIIKALVSVESDQSDLLFLVEMLTQVGAGIDPGQLIQLGPQLIAAHDRFGVMSAQSREAVKRCMRLKPIPATKPPHGF